jgi:hypothetical protein
MGCVHAMEENSSPEANLIIYNFTTNHKKNESMSRLIWENRHNLGENKKEEMLSYALTQNFNPVLKINYFWRFVATVSDPIDNLARVGCVVVPAISKYMSEDNALLASAVCGVVSLVFGKIYGYTKNKVSENTKMQLTLLELGQVFSSSSSEPSLDDQNLEQVFASQSADALLKD